MNGQMGLWDDDEAAYMGFASEMLHGSSWFNPDFPQASVHRKTPLHFWLSAFCMMLFGENTFALRFSSVSAVLMTCILIYFLGKPLFGKRVSLYASLILCSNILVIILAKMSLTDAALMLFTAVAALSMFNYLKAPSFKWQLLMGIGLSMGILTKGPPIIIVCGGIWIFLFFFHYDRKRLIQLHPWFIGLLALVPFALWCYGSYLEDFQIWQSSGSNESFQQWWLREEQGKKIHLLPFLLDWYVYRRIGGTVFGQTGFPGYHLIVIMISFVAWIKFFPKLFKSLYNELKNKSVVHLFMATWIIFGWIFWEFMPSKLISYSLSAHPAFAFLLALQIHRSADDVTSSTSVKIGHIVLILVLGFAPIFMKNQFLNLETIPMDWFFLSSTLLLIPINWFMIKKKVYLVFRISFQFMSLIALLFIFYLPQLENSTARSIKKISEKALNMVEQDSSVKIIYSGFDIKEKEVSIFYYLKKTFGSFEYMNFYGARRALKKDEKVIVIYGSESKDLFSKWIKKYYDAAQIDSVQYRPADDAFNLHCYWLLSNQNSIVKKKWRPKKSN